MNKRNVLVIAAGVAVLLVAGGLFASNMGFKLNYTLNMATGGVSASGTNTLGLPFFRQTGIDNAKQLIDDINAVGGPGSVANVQRYNRQTDGLELYNGLAGTAFNLVEAEGYFVKMNSNVNYIVVGSHDPGFTVNLLAAGGSSASGTNLFAPPYHFTGANAKDLIDDIQLDGGAGSVANVQRYNKVSDGLELYNGLAGTAFPIVPGQAYLVKVNSTVGYTPSHF